MSAEPLLETAVEGASLRLTAAGAWTTAQAEAIESLVASFAAGREAKSAEFDVGKIERLDTFGAWALERLIRRCDAEGRSARLVNVPERYRGMLAKVHLANRQPSSARPKPNAIVARVEHIGRATAGFGVDLVGLASMLGEIGRAHV